MAAVSASFLAIALLVPLRDDRRGRRATLLGNAPLRALFPTTTPDVPDAGVAAPFALTPASRAFSLLAFRKLGTTFGLVRRETGDGDGSTHHEVPDAAEIRSFEDELSDVHQRASDAEASSFAVRDGTPETVDGGESDVSTALEQDIADVAADRAATEAAPPVVVNERPSFERSHPPLTRLPLRSVHVDVTWPNELAEPARAWSARERHDFLRACARGIESCSAAALYAAWREEDVAGRLLALKALARLPATESQLAFVDALAHGTDEERAFAVDVFADRNDVDQLTRALNDRVEAIAARAALAIVGGGTRSEFETALEPLVERARLEAILALLAAVLV